jgi:PhzF family phenazine biosynthesis protein
MRRGTLDQECGVGLVRITVEGEGSERRLTFALPPAQLTSLAPEDVTELEAVLGQSVVREIAPAIVDVGAVWIVAQLPDAGRVLALEPELARMGELERRLGATGVSVFGGHERGDAALEVRSFAPSCGVPEDPVCGSGNGAIAVFQVRRGLLREGGTAYVAAQGRRVGREGRVAVAVDATGRVSVGGACVSSIDGRLNL